jgi:hypothetical protein
MEISASLSPILMHPSHNFTSAKQRISDPLRGSISTQDLLQNKTLALTQVFQAWQNRHGYDDQQGSYMMTNKAVMVSWISERRKKVHA